ncbi:MAG: hypothetical protein V3W34_00885 [Phycisphaerae bacterium]
MIIEHKKNTLFYLVLPMVDSTTPASFKTGLTVTDTAYYKDGAGAWTALAITDTFSEIGTTGMYEIDLTGAELNHDRVLIKMTAAGAADSFVDFRMNVHTIDDVLDGNDRVDVGKWLSTAVTAGLGGRPAVDAQAISGSAIAADNVEANIANLDAAISSRATAAQVNTEVDSAISDARLNELMSVALASQPAAGSLLGDLTEDDVGTQRFTANALEQAPSGTGPNMLLDTTVSVVNTQTSFDLVAGPADDDALNGQGVVFYDVSNGDTPSVRVISDYVAANKRIIIDSVPDFTVVATDKVKVFVTAPGTTAPTAAQVADAVLDEALSGHQTAGSMGAEVHLAKAMLANKRVHTISTGVDEVYDDDGLTLLRTMTPTDGGNDKIDVTPS